MPLGRGAELPLRDILIRTSRSSGPGGQHANVTASRVEAIFDVESSSALTDAQKRRVIARLGPRVTAVAQDARSQARNRELALERLRERLAEALVAHAAPARHPPDAASVDRRLDEKRRQAARKRERRPPGTDDPLASVDMRWLVDGMNVIGTRPDAWWKDRDAAMLRLVDLLERWAAHNGEDVTVVFERPPRPPIRSTVIEVAHAPKPKPNAADDEIVRRLQADPDPAAVRVVTSDRWLADRAWAAGASVEGADSFRSRVEDS